jgi:hypothetical protein
VPLVSSHNRVKTLPRPLEFSSGLFSYALRSSVWHPPHDLVSPFDAEQVPPRPPNPSHMHFWSHASSSPCQAHSPGLHFLEVFFVRVGTSAQKGSFPPSPPLLWCFCCAPYPPQPSCTICAPISLSYPCENPPPHSNPPIFSFCI